MEDFHEDFSIIFFRMDVKCQMDVEFNPLNMVTPAAWISILAG